MEMDAKKIEKGIRLLLEGVDEDPGRPGLKGTPKRVASMFLEILGGSNEDPAKHLRTIHEEKHDEMVLIKNIPLYSMCEHHLLPFAGVAHVAYIPKSGRIVGLSKIARVVEALSRRLQPEEPGAPGRGHDAHPRRTHEWKRILKQRSTSRRRSIMSTTCPTSG